jgi:hypothetical protein
MPFDLSAPAASSSPQFARQPADVADAFQAARTPDAAWAAANPERALAFLFVCPSPCEALDVLLAA